MAEDKEKELKKYLKEAKADNHNVRLYLIHPFYGPMKGIFIDLVPDITLVKELLNAPIKEVKNKFWEKTGLACQLMIYPKIVSSDTIINTLDEAEVLLMKKIEDAPDPEKDIYYFRRGEL